MKLQYIIRKYTSEVELFKDDQCPLGISITGGQKDGDRPTITNIKHGSVAHKSHCLSEGDIILSVRGLDSRGMSKKDVKRFFKDSEPNLYLKVEYIAQEACFGYCRIYSSHKMSLTLKKINGTFGFVLRKNSGFAQYPVISNIKHGSPADRDGIMMSGDRLLAVDNLSLSWIPLAEIAILLQDKEEAEFFIEYNVGVVDLSEEKETYLEITCPNTDLGMTLTSDKSLKMSISFIKPGSLAQRCGVFHVGDEILSINGIDVKTMTSDKANDLLRRFRKSSVNITFLHNGENPKLETSATPQIIHYSPAVFPPTFVPPNSRNSLYYDPIPENVFFKTVESNKNHNDYQLQIMSILSNILTNTDNLQLYLLNEKVENNSLNNKIVDKDDSYESERSNDLISFRGQVHELMKLTHNLVIYVLKNAAQLNYEFFHSTGPQKQNDRFSGESISDKVKIEFIDSLNMFANKRLMSKNSVKKLIAATVDINNNCCVCINEFYAATFAVCKVHLFISLNNKPQQEIDTIRQVLKRVSQLPFPCYDCIRPSTAESTAESQTSHSVQKSENSLIPPRTFGVGASSSSTDSNKVIRRETYSISGSQIQITPHIGFDFSQQTAMYKVNENENDNSTAYNSQSFNSSSERYTPIPSSRSTEHSSSVFFHQDALNNNVYNRTVVHNNLDINHNDALSKASSTITSLTEADKQRRIPNEDYESHSLVRPKSPFERHSTPKPQSSNFQKSLCQCKSSTGFEVPNADAPPMAGPSHAIDHTPAKAIPKRNSLKTYTDVHEVFLKAENGSFGFILGYSSFLANDDNRLPIISAIKPKSAAHKCGLLKKGDRILALNGFSTAGISIEDLESLKREIFDSDDVVLTVEFDVTEETNDVTGTFTVELDTCLKLGLVMDEPNYPSFVRGLVKGSSSHRSGQLFPGDEILSFSTLNEETLNLQTWTMRKTKTHRLTIRRESDKHHKKELSNRHFDFPLNPVSFVRSGSHFNIKRTSIRTIEGGGGCKDKMVLEQEFTLFRDPQTWDFGFLFGENPQTGNAYITDIRQGGPADNSKIVKKYDRIMEVNGVLVKNTAENSVMTLFMQTDDRVDLVTRRVLHYA